MSLVIGCIRDNEILVCADTQLKPGTDWAAEEPRNGLKIFFLNSSTLIAYAGSRIAHDAISACAQLQARGASFAESLSYVSKWRHRMQDDGRFSSGQVPDFLLGTSENPPKLYRIAGDGNPIEIQSLAWIGDSDAASAFLYCFSAAESETAKEVNQEEQEPFMLLSHCMDQIIAAPEITSVGGYSIVARGSKAGFRFLPKIKLVSPRYSPPQAQWYAIDFGTAATGGYGYTSIVPCDAGRNGYGLYFFQGRFGFFYFPNLLENRFETLQGGAGSAKCFADIISHEVGYQVEAIGELGNAQS